MTNRIYFKDFEELKSKIGQEIGVSEWFEVTQERINDFAEATLDSQWIHVDEARAEVESPFGKTIAHGFLILSLIPKFLEETISFSNIKMGINYGLDKVRFTNPVPSGAKIRARITVVEVVDVQGGVKYKNKVLLEIEGVEKPACVAEMIALLIKN